MKGRSDTAGPLAGYVVADFTQAASGPFCTQILSDLGARVIKVEPPEGDMIRGWNDALVGGVGTYFMGLNRGKESVVLDLKTESGVSTARELIRNSGVVVENYRPGVMDRLGLGYEVAKSLNDNIVYLSISGFGRTGPRAQEPAMDIIVQAVAGIMGITGENGRPPVKVGAPVADLVTGWAASSALLAGLVAKERRGTGQLIEISMLDVLVTLLSNHATGFLMTGKPVERMGSGHPQLVPYEAFETQDHEYIIIGILNERFWQKLCEAFERHDWLVDPRFHENADRVRHRHVLVPLVQDMIRTRAASDWMALLKAFDVPVAQVATFDTLFADDQSHINGIVQTLESDHFGAVKVLNSPFRFSLTPTSLGAAPPVLGEHTDAVLSELGVTSTRA